MLVGIAGENLDSALLQSRAPQHVGEGVFMCAQLLGHGLYRAGHGFVLKPLEGAREGGLSGCMTGCARGSVGLVAIPLGSALGALSKLLQSVDSTTQLAFLSPGSRAYNRRPQVRPARDFDAGAGAGSDGGGLPSSLALRSARTLRPLPRCMISELQLVLESLTLPLPSAESAAAGAGGAAGAPPAGEAERERWIRARFFARSPLQGGARQHVELGQTRDVSRRAALAARWQCPRPSRAPLPLRLCSRLPTRASPPARAPRRTLLPFRQVLVKSRVYATWDEAVHVSVHALSEEIWSARRL